MVVAGRHGSLLTTSLQPRAARTTRIWASAGRPGVPSTDHELRLLTREAVRAVADFGVPALGGPVPPIDALEPRLAGEDHEGGLICACLRALCHSVASVRPFPGRRCGAQPAGKPSSVNSTGRRWRRESSSKLSDVAPVLPCLSEPCDGRIRIVRHQRHVGIDPDRVERVPKADRARPVDPVRREGELAREAGCGRRRSGHATLARRSTSRSAPFRPRAWRRPPPAPAPHSGAASRGRTATIANARRVRCRRGTSHLVCRCAA